MPLSASRVIELLGLTRHPTCGYTAQTFKSGTIIPAGSLPAPLDGARPAGSVLYFLVTAEAHIVMHRIRSDQMYHHYQGDPLEVLLLYPDGKGEVRTMGHDLAAGQRPQLLIPAGTFHMSRTVAGAEVGWSLLGTSEWIGVEPADVETGEPERLGELYPSLRAAITDFMR